MVTRAEAAHPESERIAFLVQRDGPEAAHDWVARTVGIYTSALAQRDGYANDPAYRPLFERAIAEFQEWLGASPAAH